MKNLLLMVVSCGTLAALAADSWYWLGKVSCNTYYGGTGRYGCALKSADNWQNVATGANGVPVSGDIVILRSGVTGDFGSDFNSSTISFGGLIYEGAPSGNTSNQGETALQAGGQGIVVQSGVTLDRDKHKFNGNVAFTGSGEAIVDIPSGTLFVQKSLYGNANITLVKRGAGTLKHNEGYSQLNSAKTAYAEARSKTDGYYANRKFAFGGVKLQAGSLDMCQYYWVRDCDFQFDGPNTILGLKLFDKNNSVDRGVHSLELQNCKLRETANADGSHQVYGDDARCFIHMFGTCADSSFSGRFTNYAGLVWDPSNDVEFKFRRAVSTTAGILTVSNGTLRVSEGASFPNVSAITVSGANARFRVDKTAMASFPKADLVVANGGKLHLEMATSFKSVTINGEVPANGVYCGSNGTVKNGVCTVADWIEGEGHLVIGALPAEAAAVAATWNGTGNASTLANWSGAAELPTLTDGSAQVAVSGGSSFVADTDAWVKGFTLNTVGAFGISAAEGKKLWIGSEGLVNAANGAVTVGNVMVAGAQTWSVGGGSLTVNGDIAAVSDGLQTIKSAGGKTLNLNAASSNWTCPVLITNMVVNFNASGALGPKSANDAYLFGTGSANVGVGFANDITIDRNLWFSYDPKITVGAGHNLTFNGSVCTTNTQAMSVTAPAGSTITFNDLYMSRSSGTLKGAGTIVFKGPVHFRDRPSISETVTVELHAKGNRLNGNMGAFNGGRLKAMAPYVITKANTRRQETATTGNSADAGQNTMINSKNSFILDLNGYDQSIDQLAMHANGTSSGGHITSATPAKMHLQTVKSWWPEHNYSQGFSGYTSLSTVGGYGYEASDKGYWEDQVTLSYEAASGMVRSMMRTSSSSGNVEVVSGTLVFLRRAKTTNETFDLKDGSSNPYWRLANEDGAWPNAKQVVVKGGVLKLEHSKAFGEAVELDLSSTGKLQLEEGVRLKCASLTLGGEVKHAGVFGSTASGATTKTDSFFTGKGVVQVGTPGTLVIFR